MTKEDLKVGDYVRYVRGAINGYVPPRIGQIKEKDNDILRINDNCVIFENDVKKSSDNIVDLVECADLLVLEDAVKDINGKNLLLFNPVRCDGFTTFENNQHCMIINMDYIIPIENIKIKQILTHEQFQAMSYKVGE